MRRKPGDFLILIGLTICSVIALGDAAVSAPKNPATKPAVAAFRDDFVAPAPDRIGSDGLGPYVDGVDRVKAIVDGAGDFDLDSSLVGGPPIRFLFLDFSAPASPISAAPFLSGTVDAYFATGGGGLPDMAVGSSKRTRLAVNFPGWFIRFDPIQHPGTSNVLVRRLSDSSWEIEASPIDIGKLLQVSTVRGKMVLTDQGDFFLPFRVAVTLK